MSVTVIAVTSDQHCGSTVALCPPTIGLDDGGEYKASKAQQWLWQSWLDFWKRVDQIRTKEKARLFQVYNGDLTEGDHHGTTQILSGNSAVQGAVVAAAMKVPLSLQPDKIWLVRGTEAHVGKSAAAEEKIADGLRKNKNPIVTDPHTKTASHWHARLEVDGVRLSFAHHGRMGQRPWTKINIVANLAAEIFYEFAAREEPYPHLAVRSHHHRYADTGGAHPVRVIQTPAWQLHTSFIHRIAPDSMADIGGLIIVIRDGKIALVDAVQFRAGRGYVWRG